MAKTTVHTLDLNFLGRKSAIGAYLIQHSSGAALVESGPGSTIPGLVRGLAAYGLTPTDITHVFITHIHLDHAGASGWLASKGARIHVHPVGAPHMRNPEKLLSSAKRLYGDKMDALWGEFLPVPDAHLVEVQDGDEFDLGSMRITGIHTPGHAEHHVVYLVDGVAFTGDVGGVRLAGPRYLRLPLVPPELHLGKWRESIRKLLSLDIERVVPTHFGIYPDGREHLNLALHMLDATELWLEAIMADDPPIEDLRRMFVSWQQAQGMELGISEDVLSVYEIANPTWISADGLQRYWRKIRLAG
ncbi:MAG: MBL fold metallo-hydrolase [Chloroflexota bacterium]